VRPTPGAGRSGRLDRVAGLRKEYTRAGLAEADASADPVEKFRAWFEAALAANVREPNATTLATATSDRKPSARVVPLNGHDRRGSVSCQRHQIGMERGLIVGGPRFLLNGPRSGG
jgi:pyridoxine/pyridoxamine 5'-phosphate oxidase